MPTGSAAVGNHANPSPPVGPPLRSRLVPPTAAVYPPSICTSNGWYLSSGGLRVAYSRTRDWLAAGAADGAADGVAAGVAAGAGVTEDPRPSRQAVMARR